MMIELALCYVHSFLENLVITIQTYQSKGWVDFFVLNTITILLAVHGKSYFRSTVCVFILFAFFPYRYPFVLRNLLTWHSKLWSLFSRSIISSDIFLGKVRRVGSRVIFFVVSKESSPHNLSLVEFLEKMPDTLCNIFAF